MYFVKVDIKGAFDTINQDMLLEILGDFFHSPRYHLQKQIVLAELLSNVKRTYMKFAKDPLAPPLTRVEELISKNCRNSVVIDQAEYFDVTRSSIIQLLTEHIKCNLVQVSLFFTNDSSLHRKIATCLNKYKVYLKDQL